MPVDEFIIYVYCSVKPLVDEIYIDHPIRQRGFAPKLSDAEVITMEIVGEFLGYDTDKGIWRYFRNHWHNWFPQLGSRANFSKQASNLWEIKQQIQKILVNQLDGFMDDVHISDGFPMPVCKFARARYSHIFKDDADYGYCASKKETYYGFHGHLTISGNGIISGIVVTAANIGERETLWEMVPPIQGLLIGDKGYIGQQLQEELQLIENIQLETPKRCNMKDERSPKFVKCLMSKRRLVETVIGQLTERFHIQKVRSRDLWHLTNRVTRKIMAHTIGVFLNRLLGRPPLQFESLVEA
ncbi:IS982 family transposase [Candidatus Parabeggiatoa sp. HSG14]|uniref:IS982 family transposase n=1 Tax=Candidatus Parabeggiatoa sp. HSG14 TaxID=3055593 RepID=UPI0025A7453E|nr:IS982 family transposase [Thiotrichales bacterium HSG14]